MVDLSNKEYCPTLTDLEVVIRTPTFIQFCEEMTGRFRCKISIEFSSCSMEPGWNLKFKRSGKNLCTVYPREGYFTTLVVIGTKQKEAVESIFSELNQELQQIYNQTQEGNGQRWLMIDVEDKESMYEDVQKLIEIRSRK